MHQNHHHPSNQRHHRGHDTGPSTGPEATAEAAIREGLKSGLIEISYARSGGPGGQNVNKTSSKAVLHYSFMESAVLTPEQVQMIANSAEFRNRLAKEGTVIHMQSEKHRDQKLNKEEVIGNLQTLLTRALTPEVERKATEPTAGSRERRHNEKEHRSHTKEGRRQRHWE